MIMKKGLPGFGIPVMVGSPKCRQKVNSDMKNSTLVKMKKKISI